MLAEVVRQEAAAFQEKSEGQTEVGRERETEGRWKWGVAEDSRESRIKGSVPHHVVREYKSIRDGRRLGKG